MSLKKFMLNSDVENIAWYFDFKTLEKVYPDEEIVKKP